MREENLEMVENIAYRDRFIGWPVFRRLTAQFHERYKTIYPAKIYPPTRLLRRCHREIGDRQLTNYDLRETLTRPERGRQWAPLDIYGKVHNIDGHMALLRTYLLAMAIVGAE